MLSQRCAASLPVLALAVLGAVQAKQGAVPWSEVGWLIAALSCAFIPSAWIAPAGWRRRAAEVTLLPLALIWTTMTDALMREMLTPVLVLVAAIAALAAALARSDPRDHPLLVSSCAVALRCGPGAANEGAMAAGLALAAVATLAYGLSRRIGLRFGIVVALFLPWLPLEHWPKLTLVLLCLGGLLASGENRGFRVGWKLDRWLPGLGGAAILAIALAPWGGMTPAKALPGAGWFAVLAVLACALLAPRLRPGLAGALWCAVALLCGPVVPAPPDRAGFTLSEERPQLTMSEGSGESYLIDIALARAGELPSGAPVATLEIGASVTTIRAGVDAAEWAQMRPWPPCPTRHGLPEDVVYRPASVRGLRFWRVAGRQYLAVPAGVQPVLQRNAELPAEVDLIVHTAGPSRITAPRSRPFLAWLWASIVVVAGLQVIGGSLGLGVALVPWTVLVAAELAVRAPVEPLRLMIERYGVDLCLAAVLSAWLPVAWKWMRAGRFGAAALGLLLPLAVAASGLTPPLYGDEPYHLALLQSMTQDLDLDLANNLDLEEHPSNRVFAASDHLFHSPLLAFLLLPGYLVAGRAGALALLALCGALVVALVARRARGLGLAMSRVRLVALAMIVTYPLAVYTMQIWPELIGALALSLILVAAAGQQRWLASGVAVIATVIKTRIALVAFPVALAAWARGKARPRPVLGLFVLALAGGFSLAVGWAFMGHPFGYYRRLHHLIPDNPGLALRVLGGLLFDPAGGILWTAPVVLLAIAGLSGLWRRGGTGERAAAVGGALTVAALLHSIEWYAGGSPPARYLVVLLPLLALAAACALCAPRPWRRLSEVLVAPSLLAWWVLVTRPHLSINPGDGGWWIGDRLARRFLVESGAFFPSFLLPNVATAVVPAVVIALALGLVFLVSRWPGACRWLVRTGVSLWLLVAASLVLALHLRCDRVVEAEAPQVRRLGGHEVPPAGTVSRFSHRNGWRIRDGEGLVVPLNLKARASLRLHGWLEGTAQAGAALELQWDEEPARQVPVRSSSPDASLKVSGPPGGGRHSLRITLRSPVGGAAVVDRIEVLPPTRGY